MRPAELTSLALLGYGFFDEIEPAIRFAEEPYYLKQTQPKLYPLAVLIGLAENLARGHPQPSPMLEALKGMRINPSILTEALKAVVGKAKK